MTRHIAFLGAFPLVVLLVASLAEPGNDLQPCCDRAVIEGMVGFAGDEIEELGLYSRFGWSHPGPSYFYFLLPFYEAFGEQPIAMAVGAIMLNLIAVGGVIAAAARVVGRELALWSALVLAVFMATVQPTSLRDWWTPFAIILLFALFTALCAAVAAGRLAALPLAALSGSVVVQMHVGAAGGVGVIAAAALVLYVVCRLVEREPLIERAGRGVRATLRGVAPILIAIVVGVVVWLPPLVEEAQHSPGNLSRVKDFLRSQPASHSTWEARWTIVSSYAVLPQGFDSFGRPEAGVPDPVRPSGFSTAWVVVTLLLTLAGAILGFLRRRWFAASLCTFALLLVPVAYYALQRVAGPLWPYLILWLASGGLTAWIGIGGALGPELARLRAGALRRAVVPVLGGALALVTVVNVVAVIGLPAVKDDHDDEDVPAAARIVDRYLDERGSERPLLEVPADERWETAAGVAVALRRDGREPAVDPGAFHFGTHMAPTGREDAHVVLAGPGSQPAPDASLVELGQAGDTYIYARR